MINILVNRAIVFQRRHNLIPFEAAFALFAIYSSMIGLIKFGAIPNALNKELGGAFSTGFDVIFLMAGLGMYFGVGFGRRDFEAFGLMMVITSLLIRVLLIIWTLGFNPITFNNYIFNAIFICACIIRLNTLFKKRIIIRLDEIPPVGQLSYGKPNNSSS